MEAAPMEPTHHKAILIFSLSAIIKKESFNLLKNIL